MTKIKFGTSGWRAIIADEFTYANVRLATEAIGRYVKRRNNDSPTLLVGYDTRFASEDFGLEVARVLSSQNIRARLCSQAVPTPGVAFTIVREKLDGAIAFGLGAAGGVPQRLWPVQLGQPLANGLWRIALSLKAPLPTGNLEVRVMRDDLLLADSCLAQFISR